MLTILGYTHRERVAMIARLRTRSNDLRKDSNRLSTYSRDLRVRSRELSQLIALLYENGILAR